MAARLIAKRAAQLASVPVVGALAFYAYEPGFRREVKFWAMVIPPMTEYWWRDKSEHERLHAKYAPKALAGILELGAL